MSLNNPVVNSFLKTDVDLLFVLKTKVMRKLVNHLTPDEKYAFIERVIDGLPGAVIESDILTYNMNGDQGLFVSVTYVPKKGNGEVRGRNNLEETPRNLYNISNPRKEVGYKLLSYYLAIRELITNLRKALQFVKDTGAKISKRDKRAKALLGRLCWFIFLSMHDVAYTDKEERNINKYLAGLAQDGDSEDNPDTEAADLLGGLVDGSTLATELAKSMVGEHGNMLKIAMFDETGIPFIVMRDITVDMDLDNVDDEYLAKIDEFIQHYREYLSVHDADNIEESIKRVICGMRLAYGVVKALRYPSPDKSEVVKQYREVLTNWSVLAKRLYNVIDQF